MKRTIAILLALMMCMSILTACGGGEVAPEPTPKQEETTEPVQEESIPEPEPEPEPTETQGNQFTVSHEGFGSIGFSVSDESLEVILAEPDQESLELFEGDTNGSRAKWADQIQYQKAVISGDDFVIVIGFTDYYNAPGSLYKTYGMLARLMQGSRTDDPSVLYGGLEGFNWTNNYYTMAFPATSQFGGRQIFVSPSFPGVEDLDRNELKELTEELMERPDINAILDTLTFDGEFISEPGYETEPIETDYVIITPTDGWEFIKVDEGSNNFNLGKDGISNQSALPHGEIEINTRSSNFASANEEIEKLRGYSNTEDLEFIDNVMLGNQEFVVYHSGKANQFFLYTSIPAGPLDLNSPGYVHILVWRLDDYNEALPMLNMIKVK